jgi:heme/copper-type cytochrome/quinol oxidase subunit 2
MQLSSDFIFLTLIICFQVYLAVEVIIIIFAVKREAARSGRQHPYMAEGRSITARR